jgi:hypothetical protein
LLDQLLQLVITARDLLGGPKALAQLDLAD